MGPARTPDQRANRLASRQHAAISHSQAVEAGLTAKQIKLRLGSRRWIRRASRVYVIAGSPATWQQDAAVACLAGPDGTVASHLTAAALLGLTIPPPVPHVTVAHIGP